ncbi:response regulator [Piscinibacter gummiphilus]|uniref:Response regulator n=1 Tax=Piscinibacter gummiphilus TaxID=946333 RepID=A0ABZ0CW83_9BURK|nr:response regulator [Piscinibacter gummiphilus]WOB07123.1 response regulator [Piscinibacter gummiphilus]
MKILIADDYPDVADLLSELLQLEFDCETVVVLNGADALHEALKRRPDVSLLDIDMPIMAGVECAAAMRLKWGTDAGLIVAVTGRSSREAGESGHFNHVLRKPTDFEELVKLIRARFPSNPLPDPEPVPGAA